MDEYKNNAGGSILFVAFYFLPSPTAASRRFSHLLHWAGTHFDHVFVIKGRRSAGAVEGTKQQWVIDVPDLRAVLGGSGPAKTVSSDTQRRFGWLLRLRQSFPLLHITDDGGPLYRFRAHGLARDIVKNADVRTVFSSYRPWSDHLVARRLKQKFPHLHWIADFRDLPVDPLRKEVWFPALQRWFARRVIASADEVWCVSEGQAEWMRKLHSRVVVHRNKLLRLPPARTAPQTEKFTVVYTGSLYPRLQSLQPLISVIGLLVARGKIVPDEIKFIYRGKDAELFRTWLADLPAGIERDIQPYVNRERAVAIQREAQLLLLMNWSAENYYGVLLAKTFDYLATGRPILGLTNGPQDKELTAIVETSGSGRVFHTGQAGDLTEWFLSCYTKWQVGGALGWTVDVKELRRLL